MADIRFDTVHKTVTEGFYVTVGLGVIAFQKAQVQRQELLRQCRSQLRDLVDRAN